MATTRERALNVPAFPTAETRTFVGPFLRFGGGTDPGSRHWRGSVLCLTRPPAPPPTAAAVDGRAVPGGADAARAGLPTGAVIPHNEEKAPNGSGTAAAAASTPGPAPVLILQDTGPGHGSAGRQEVQAQPLDTCLGWTAWRFDLQLPLVQWQRPVSYHLEAGKAGRGCLAAGKQRLLAGPSIWTTPPWAAPRRLRQLWNESHCKCSLANHPPPKRTCCPAQPAGHGATPAYTFWLPAQGQPMHWGEGRGCCAWLWWRGAQAACGALHAGRLHGHGPLSAHASPMLWTELRRWQHHPPCPLGTTQGTTAATVSPQTCRPRRRSGPTPPTCGAMYCCFTAPSRCTAWWAEVSSHAPTAGRPAPGLQHAQHAAPHQYRMRPAPFRAVSAPFCAVTLCPIQATARQHNDWNVTGLFTG